MNQATVSAPISDFFDEPDSALTPFADALSTLGEQIELTGVETFQTPLGTVFTASVTVGLPLLLTLRGLPIALVVGAADEDNPIELTVLLEEQGYVEIDNAGLALRLQLPFLHPVDTPDAPVEIRLDSGIHVSADDIALLDPDVSLSIPRSEIGETGIIIALDDLSPVLSADNVPDVAFFYGQDEGFRGLHAAASVIEFMPALLFAGQPGLRIEGCEILIGAQGLCCDFLMEFALADDDGDLLTDSEVVGGLADGGFPLVVNWLRARIRDNIPRAFSANGYVRVPLFELSFSLTMGLAIGEQGWRYTSRLQSLAAGEISLAAGSVSYSEVLFNGTLGNDRADFGGLIAGLRIDLAPFLVEAGSVQLELARDPQHCRLLFQLADVDLGPLGTVQSARLLIEQQYVDDEVLVQFETNMVWADLQQRLEFASLPDNFPLPPDDAEVAVAIHYDNGDWRFRFAATLSEVDALWAFLPANARPEVPQAALTLDMSYDAGTDKFTGEGSITLSLGLPDLPQLPGMSLLHVGTGGEDGLIDLTVKGGFAEVDGTLSPYMSASIDSALTVEVDFPGLAQPVPPIYTSLTGIDFDLGSDDQGDFSGGMTLQGDFVLRPLTPMDMGLPLPPVIALQLEKLLNSVGLTTLTGSASLALRFSGDDAEFKMSCNFSEAGLEIDLFDLIAGAARGIPGPAGIDNPANSIDLDIEFAFELKQIALQIGDLDADDNSSFSLGLTMGLAFPGGNSDVTLALSDQHIAIGFDELPIPISLPQMPLNLDDLNTLRDANGRWDYDDTWLQTVEPGLSTQIALLDGELGSLRNQITAIEASLPALEGGELIAQQALLRQLRDRDFPAKQKQAFKATANKFLMEAVLAVHQLLGSEANQATYQLFVEAYQGFIDQTLGRIHFDTELSFVISDARFVLPFNNPSDIRVEGSARLSGFGDDDPLRPLGNLGFKLGLSADAIYFGVEGGGEPIPLPEFGRYSDGSIKLQRFNIGYGYSKNSLNIDFAGELKLPPTLIEDLDSSDLIGVGIRLPLQSALAFKLDLIPITLGEVNFVVPLFEFDIDLRRAGIAGVASGGDCTPAWDGLQLIAPGLLRMDLKRFRFAPFFGPMPAPNYVHSYDIRIGNEGNGFSFVCDNYLQITPLMGQYPIPLLADGATPFFENLCVNLNWAGFQLRFKLQRPFPSMSPLAIFELLGLLSDPGMRIDPEGQLASMVRASIDNAVVTLPPGVARIFPELGPVLDRELNYTINLATVITIAQQITGVVKQAVEASVGAAGDMQRLVDEIVANPPDLSSAGILRALPPELRRYRLHGSFVGFDASAFVFLLSPGEALQEFERLQQPTPHDGESLLFETDFSSGALNQWQAVNHGLKQKRGKWEVIDGTLRQTRNVGHNDDPQYGPLLIYQGQRFGDGSFTSVLSSSDDDGIGVVFRYRDARNHYRFRMTSQQRRWTLVRLHRGRATLLLESHEPYIVGRRYSVSVRTQNRFDPIAAAGLAKGRPLSVAIEITVDGNLWCSIEDSDSTLADGHVGLSCWWNQGARFHSLRVYGEVAGRLEPGVMPNEHLVGELIPAFPDQPIFKPADPANNLLAGTGVLEQFSAEDLEQLAHPEGGAASVLVGAQVQMLGVQSYAFLGIIDQAGNFALLSHVGVDPLVLGVAGIAVELPLTIAGRVALRGRSAGADSWALVEARGWGAWDVLPLGLARLELASAAQPATFKLHGDGRFGLVGSGRLLLFNERLVLSGSADISHTHCFLDGSLTFELMSADGNSELIALNLDSRGRLGPERQFTLAGAGSLSLLGRALTGVSGSVSEQGVELKARLQVGGKNQWPVAGLPLSELDMQLRGRIDFPSPGQSPALELAGATRFTVLGASVEGEGHLNINSAETCIGAAGALSWQGRDWLAGRIELCNDHIRIGGRTTFALDLTPQDVLGDIEIASLYFTIDLSGSFDFTAAEGLKKASLSLHWTLALRLPGAQQQILPLASQQKRFSKSNLGNAGTLRQLIYIPTVNFIPFGGVIIPLPVIDMDSGTDVYVKLHNGLPTLSTNAPPPPPTPTPLFTVPGLSLEDTTLNAVMDNFNITVKLAWKNGELGITLERPGKQEFIPLRTMFD